MSIIQILVSSLDDEFQNLHKRHLLIDTNFLIDAFKYPTQFNELLLYFERKGFTLVSIQATLVEFAKGSKSIEDFSKKITYYNNIINRILPLDPQIHENVSDIIKVLLKKGGQLSYTDCLLLGTTMKYKDSIYLLTKDRSDVPISIFNVSASIMIETQDNNCTFNIYEYREEKYENILKKRIEDTNASDIPF